MMNKMICVETSANGNVYFSFPAEKVDELLSMIEGILHEGNVRSTTVFNVGEMPLEALPEEVKAEALDVLKAFDKVSVEYEGFKWHVTTGCCIRSKYSGDHFVAGTYASKDVYTEEQRRQNFLDSFGYLPANLR